MSYIQFTGSVSSGRKVSELASKSKKFIHVGLELGGNDSAYVRSDADPVSAAENLVDGAMYNSGQSCCGIQRIYVHQSLMDQFVKTAVSEVMVWFTFVWVIND